jgi:hypothetical protein
MRLIEGFGLDYSSSNRGANRSFTQFRNGFNVYI